MILWHGLVLFIAYLVRTSGAPYAQELFRNGENELSTFSLWPSPHNAATLMRIRKREAQNIPDSKTPVAIEGGMIEPGKSVDSSVAEVTTANETRINQKLPHDTAVHPVAVAPLHAKDIVEKPSPLNNTINSPAITTPAATVSNVTTQNGTVTKEVPDQMDINNPGVLKRALIVFGGFSLLGVAYYVFFKRKGSKNETNNTNNSDANQFRYGVLQSEDRRDNLELSRIPLTMDSDDDDEEDLEIFDLGQKKKSLSYVNLQTQEDDVDLSLPGHNEYPQGSNRQDLLLDIEDKRGDTLLNWSSGTNNSII